MSEIDALIKKKIKQNPSREKIYNEERAKYKSAIAVLKLRDSLGLTQSELAGLIKKPQSTISRIETGETQANTETLELIAKATNKELHIEFV
ncbi:helix-turn-helix domain-containing protein [Macrococcus armenti]|uniref:helix-turn-helix domain-containing protein n=1 Tax=Macrococcus armenti TaxID=2875764 RepID=UPI001CCC6969|nr:helix-turn-helix transcriptional regulator [Macrococcus armenti]UBH16600.1 helix-turn-helix transcriptional regulator [Macrococcus armenti]UBH21234.1 helix-turn-helix transcriptional regulator [Macrococcus armenti]